ncbi:MAG: hypothetical protein K8W52_37950 [Deltaproteobacteria bacterium]|nr:hypothetical protein [Deltaproteobacteria bacterium]
MARRSRPSPGEGYPNVVDRPGVPRDPAWPTLELRADPGVFGSAVLGLVGVLLAGFAIGVPARAGSAVTGGEVFGAVAAAGFGAVALWFAVHGLFTRVRFTLQPQRVEIERRRFGTTLARYVVPRDHLRDVALEESVDDGRSYRVIIRADKGDVALVDVLSSGNFVAQQQRIAAFLGVPACAEYVRV